eukprot:jgi/Tetstr1/458898/TSEL_000365.t1
MQTPLQLASLGSTAGWQPSETFTSLRYSCRAGRTRCVPSLPVQAPHPKKEWPSQLPTCTLRYTRYQNWQDSITGWSCTAVRPFIQPQAHRCFNEAFGWDALLPRPILPTRVRVVTAKREGLGKRCKRSGKTPSFGLPGDDSSSAWCCASCPTKPHEAPNNAMDMVTKTYACGRSEPCIGLPGKRCTLTRWCAFCPTQPDGAVYVVSKRGRDCGRSQPSMGLPQQGPCSAQWCASCPTQPGSAVNLGGRKRECGKRQPCSRSEGRDSARCAARWCDSCLIKPDSAANVVDKRC